MKNETGGLVLWSWSVRYDVMRMIPIPQSHPHIEYLAVLEEITVMIMIVVHYRRIVIRRNRLS